MIKNCAALVGVALCWGADGDHHVVAQQEKTDAATAAIRKTAAAFEAAFAKKDAAALGKMWSQDGEYVDESG
ncbi:MAG: hypothetical protein AAF961_06160, partial [Planctomycetota bacterium]